MRASRSGEIITFYSYKGGTGRSMLLANVAWILASNGRRVLAVDWDLEAPGLYRYFHPFLVDKDLTSSDGVIDFVIDFMVAAMMPEMLEADAERQWYVPYANLVRYAASLDWEFPSGGTLDFIGAGRQGPSYSTRVNSFNWQDFYDRFGGGAFLEQAKETIKQRYDYILIDSRTGVSDTSGICTLQLPDTLVVCFTMNNQSIEGAAAVTESVRQQRADGIRILPVATRAELSEKNKLELRRRVARERFERFLAPPGGGPWWRYWSETEVLYIPYYAFEELLATFRDQPGDQSSILGVSERITSYLTDGRVTRSIRVSEPRRLEVLSKYEGTLAPAMTLGEAPPSGRLFISYRRQEAGTDVPRLYDQLSRHFGVERVLLDVDMLSPGADFQEAIDAAVSSSAVVLAVIGPDWHRRLDDPADVVRLELTSALASGSRVIPVLVNGATMPLGDQLPSDLRGLARRQAIEFSDARWDYDMTRLIAVIERSLASAAMPPASQRPTATAAKLPVEYDNQTERLLSAADGSQALADAWREHRQWSNAASRLGWSIVRWRSVAPALVMVGAVLATLATQIGLRSWLGRVLSLAAALALAVVPIIRAAKLGKDRIEAWTRARSVSEALKAETYLYLMRTPPYDWDDRDRDRELLKQVGGILSQIGDLAGETVGTLDADKPLPDVHDVDSYLRLRVQPQIDDYYRPQAAKQQQRLSVFRGAEFALGVLAALLGAIAAAARLDSVGVWVAVATTVGAAITAHIAAARYEDLVISYLSTAMQLRSLLRSWEGRPDKTPEAAAQLVRQCEDVISRENESWMAAWSRGEDQALPSSPAA